MGERPNREGEAVSVGYICPECGSIEFSLVTYERVLWSVCGRKMEIEETEGSTSLVGYHDEWRCVECGWGSREAPPYVTEEEADRG